MTANELHARLVVAWANHKSKVSQVRVTAAAWGLYDEVTAIFAKAREEGPDPVEVGTYVWDLRGTLMEAKVNPCDSLHVRFILALRSYVGDIQAYNPKAVSQAAQVSRLLEAVARLAVAVVAVSFLVALAVTSFEIVRDLLVGFFHWG